jgi:hypothetical protein
MPYTPENTKGTIGAVLYLGPNGGTGPNQRNSPFRLFGFGGQVAAPTHGKYYSSWTLTPDHVRVSPLGDVVLFNSGSSIYLHRTDGTNAFLRSGPIGGTLSPTYSSGGGSRIEFSPDGSMIAFATTTAGVIVLETATLANVFGGTNTSLDCNSICWNLAGTKLLAMYNGSNTPRLWDLTNSWFDLAASQGTTGISTNAGNCSATIGGPNDAIVISTSLSSPSSVTTVIIDTVPTTWTKSLYTLSNQNVGAITPNGEYMIYGNGAFYFLRLTTTAGGTKGSRGTTGTPYTLGGTVGADYSTGTRNLESVRLYDGRYLALWTGTTMIQVYDCLASGQPLISGALPDQTLQTTTTAWCLGYVGREISNANTTPVVDEDGAPLSGIRVQAYDRVTGSPQSTSVTTDAQGRYSLWMGANSEVFVTLEGLSAGQSSAIIDRVTPV